MDVLKEIELQINSIKYVDNSTYLDSIFTHINRAEHYYLQGKVDSNYFNDVIYRCNQAYEGALKESYKVLADKTLDEVFKKTPNEIEKYFEANCVFHDRVLQLFKNYRQEWRNKSTHDYKLFFDESEAFIAMTSVASFVHLLLKQILEKNAFNMQLKRLDKEKNALKQIKEIAISKNRNPVDKLVDMIIEFSKQDILHCFDNISDVREAEIMGLFHAYIESAGKSIITQREPHFLIGERRIYLDFLIKIDGEPIILEFKKTKVNDVIVENAINQILIYMQAVNILNGIVYCVKVGEQKAEPEIVKKEYLFEGKKYEVTTIIA